MKKRSDLFYLVFATFIILLSGCGNNKEVEISVKEFNKHGNVILNTTFDYLKENNIEIADIVKVSINNESYNIPVGTAYSDVDSGNMILRYDLEDSKVILAINGGNFASTTNMAKKEVISEDPGYRWNVSVDKVSLSLYKKKGYENEYTIRQLERTNNREDYSSLSDASYANCRKVLTTGIKDNMLFRGTTPLDNKLNRDTYAMSFIENNNIKSIINLNDSYDEMITFDTYNDSYYFSCAVSNTVMDYDFTSVNFKVKVKECIEFMINNDGPYYIHCKEGKDRTGILIAIIECVCGATYDEIINDYMETYINFYKVEKNSDTYNIIYQNNIEKTLIDIFNVKNLKKANLKEKAKEYLLSCNISKDNLNAFLNKLGK